MIKKELPQPIAQMKIVDEEIYRLISMFPDSAEKTAAIKRFDQAMEYLTHYLGKFAVSKAGICITRPLAPEQEICMNAQCQRCKEFVNGI